MDLDELDPDKIINDDDKIILPVGENSYFSNKFPHKITMDGITFPSVENYIQYSRATDFPFRDKFITMEPHEARKLGRKLRVKGDAKTRWRRDMHMCIKKAYMEKYFGTELEIKLIATFPREIKITHWNILKEVRDIIIKERIPE